MAYPKKYPSEFEALGIKELEEYATDVSGTRTRISEALGLYTIENMYVKWTTSSLQELRAFVQGIEFGAESTKKEI